MQAPESPFERYKASFVFPLFNASLIFRAQSAKKPRMWFAIFNFSEKLLNIFEMVFKKNMECSYKNRSRSTKNISKESLTTFCCLWQSTHFQNLGAIG